MFVVEGDRAEKTMLRKRRNGNCLAVGFTVVSVPLIFIYLGYYIGSLFMPLPPRFSKPGIVKDMSLLNYSWYNTHNLTIAFAGGLGNQMFQYAALYGISKANGFRPLLCGETVVGRVFPRLKVRRIDQAVGPVTKSYGAAVECVRQPSSVAELHAKHRTRRVFPVLALLRPRSLGHPEPVSVPIFNCCHRKQVP